MSQQLPLVSSIPNQRVGTTLGGKQYILDVRWNARAEAWFLDVLQEDETPIVRGIKVVLGAFLGGRCVDAARPPGVFMAADLAGTDQEAGFDDLGDRVVVFFLGPEDL